MRILSICLAVVLVGCAGPDRIADTASGRPEAMFANTTPTQISDRIASLCADGGAFVSEKTSASVVCSMEATGMDRLIIGNAYSTPPMGNGRFTLISVDNGVRVILYQWLETQMTSGQIVRREVNNNRDFNGGMDFLRLLANR